MKLTKYAHACVVLEEQDQKLVIDPGEFTPDFGDTDKIAAVVVTHAHGDHFDPKHLDRIIAANPTVKVFTTQEVASQWKDSHAQAVQAGETQTVGPFILAFFGELHAEIHAIRPRIQNTGVLVNDAFYYPGDSFVLPEKPVTLLAVPAGAPWLKTGESLDFIKTVKPTRFFRTHDGLLNDNGVMVNDAWFKMAAEEFGAAFEPLNPGDSTEV